MAARSQRDSLINWAVCRGRNGYDAPAVLPDDMAVAAVNVTLVRGAVAQKRFGCSAQAISGTFSGYNAIGRFIPGQSDAAAELFIVDRSGTTKIGRVAAGTAFSNLTLSDNVSSLPQNVCFATLNGKFFICYDSTVNRLHVFDPSMSTTTIRRVGLADPAAPTVANTGSGSYAATARYYRIQWITNPSSNDRIASNLGPPSTVFTPSGSGTAARVTRPTAAGESEDHWVVYGSADDTIYYKLSGEIAIATTTYDDSVNPSDYPDGEAAPEDGAFTPWPSVKWLISTGDRLVGYGVYESTTGTGAPPKDGRVYFSPVMDTTDFDDEERVSLSLRNKGYIDISRNAGSEDRAICGPMNGQILVFQSRGLTMLVQTGNNEIPYRRVLISQVLGAVSNESCFSGEDESGQECIYFLDPTRGPYRYGSSGLQWLGYDVQDVWATVNLAATNKVAHGTYDPEKRRVTFSVATGSSNDPDTDMVFEVREGQATEVEGVRYGWTTHNGLKASGRCSVMFPDTFGVTMGRRLKRYVGDASNLLRTDDAATTSDNGTAFMAYITSKAWSMGGPLVALKKLVKAWIQTKTAANVELQLSLIRNYGDQADTIAVQGIDPGNYGQSRIVRRFDAAQLADAYTVQTTIGDASAVANNWQIDQFQGSVEVTSQEVGNNLP